MVVEIQTDVWHATWLIADVGVGSARPKLVPHTETTPPAVFGALLATRTDKTGASNVNAAFLIPAIAEMVTMFASAMPAAAPFCWHVSDVLETQDVDRHLVAPTLMVAVGSELAKLRPETVIEGPSVNAWLCCECVVTGASKVNADSMVPMA